jgi:hypothetical protein
MIYDNDTIINCLVWFMNLPTGARRCYLWSIKKKIKQKDIIT